MSRLSRSLLCAAPLLLALGMSAAHANEASVRKAVEAFFKAPTAVVDTVTRTRQAGLYEIVLVTGELIYTDEAVSFFIDGHIIDTRTRKDLTGARLEQLSAIDFKTLPLTQAIKRVNGNGKRILVTFEDPYCSYCKRMTEELQKVKDVSIYTFLFPILSPESAVKSRSIWCAKDPSAAWLAWIVDAKEPQSPDCDSSVIERNVALGRKLRINGTPTLFLADGTRIGGYREAGEVEHALAEVKTDSKTDTPDEPAKADKPGKAGKSGKARKARKPGKASK
jgi:thiol:disulfide interchange protein DsbC